MSRNKRYRTFRFPFDIDKRVFLVLAAVFFILAIYPVQKKLFPGHTGHSLKHRIEADLEHRIHSFDQFSSRHADLFSSVYTDHLSKQELKELMGLPYSLFFYRHDTLVRWNDIGAAPGDLSVEGIKSVRNFDGYQLKVTRKLNAEQTVVAVFDVKYEHKVEEESNPNHFYASDPENDFGFTLSLDKVAHGLPVLVQGVPQFYLFKKDDYRDILDNDAWRLFLSALPFILFGVSIHTYFKVAIKRRNIPLIFGLLLLTAIGIRSLGYLFSFPNDFTDFQLFSEQVFASDVINRSLGDVFINMCLCFWILVFFVMNVQGKVLRLRNKFYSIPFVVGIFVAVMCFGIYLTNLSYDLVSDSVIVFDTTLLNQLNLYTFVGLLTFMVIFANFLLLAIICYNYFQVVFTEKFIKYVLLAFLYVIIRLLYHPKAEDCIDHLFFSMGGLFVMMDLPVFRIKFDFNSYMLLLWMIIISLGGSFFLVRLIDRKEMDTRQKYAERLLFSRDTKTELELFDIVNALHHDKRLQDSVMQQPEKVLNTYLFEQYLYRFSNRFFIEVIGPNNALADLTPGYIKPQPWQTLYSPDHYDSIQLLQGNDGISYRTFLFGKQNGKPQNDLMIRLTQSMDLFYTNENITGLSDFEQTIREHNYSTAIYQDSELINSYGPYLFDNNIKPAILFGKSNTYRNQRNGYSEFWYKPDNDKRVILIVKENFFYTKMVTIFAYLFFIYFLVITLYIFGNIVARSNLDYKRFLNLMSLNLRLRVHVAILSVVFLSFIAIGYITSYYLIRRFELKTKNEVNRNLENLKTDVLTSMSGADTLSESDYRKRLISEVSLSSDRFQYPVNVYDLQSGRLLYSSLNYLNHLGLVADRIHPLAFYDIRSSRKQGYAYEESFHKLNYLSAYSVLKDGKNNEIAVIQLPFISSDMNERTESRSILITLVNIYVFVFLISSFIALLITNSVVKPFNYIVKQFTKINLSKTNQPLTWQYSDEIGLLVKEYNRMLRKLENSTVQLAKSERELAWREMAKQVAHEIKNPLTPMKLSLQMLERAIQNNKTNITELTMKVTTTLIEQIDNLTLIATNFSNFAKMPELKREVFLLNELLYSVTGMYNDDSYNEFLFIIPDYDIYIYADKSQLIRVFTNILQNAIQAIPETRKGNISLTVSKAKDNFVCISISDNGEGITKEKGKKLFEPYFTTKSSGTGLGLAMCKDIIEQFGGKIRYESILQQETTFNIFLPIVENDEAEQEA